jgi:hypothetical protein
MKKIVFFIAAAIVLIIVLLLAMYPCRLCLIVTDHTGRDVFSKEVRTGDVFDIKYTHSVEKVEVVDMFLIMDDGTLLLRNTSCGSMGAGLPSGVEDNVTIKDGLFVVENLNRSFDRINMITGSLPRHRLVIADVEYSLLDLAGDGKSFIISQKRKSLASAIISWI